MRLSAIASRLTALWKSAPMMYASSAKSVVKKVFLIIWLQSCMLICLMNDCEVVLRLCQKLIVSQQIRQRFQMTVFS